MKAKIKSLFFIIITFIFSALGFHIVYVMPSEAKIVIQKVEPNLQEWQAQLQLSDPQFSDPKKRRTYQTGIVAARVDATSLVVLDADFGTQKNKFEIGYNEYRIMDNTIYISKYNAGLLAKDLLTGEEKWFSSDFKGNPNVALSTHKTGDGRRVIYSITTENHLYGLEDLGSSYNQLFVVDSSKFEHPPRWISVFQVPGGKEWLIVSGIEGFLYFIDPISGEILQKFSMEERIYFPPQIREEKCYLVTEGQMSIVAVNLQRSLELKRLEVIWRYQLSKVVLMDITLFRNMVYVVTEDEVLALREKSDNSGCELAWKYQFSDALRYQLVASEQYLILASNDIIALKHLDGALSWSYNERIESVFQRKKGELESERNRALSPVEVEMLRQNHPRFLEAAAPPFVVGNAIFCVSIKGHIYAITPLKEDFLGWVYRPPSLPTMAPILTRADIYVGSDDGMIYGFQNDNGTPFIGVSGITGSLVGLASNGDAIYMALSDGSVYKLLKGGSRGVREVKLNEVWKKEVSSQIIFPPIVVDNKIYLACEDGYVRVLDDIDSESLKTLSKAFFSGGSKISSPLRILDGRFLCYSTEGSVFNVIDINAQEISSIPIDYGAHIKLPCSNAKDDIVCVASEDGNLFGINLQDKVIIWRGHILVQNGVKITSAPVISKNGTIFVTLSNGQILRFNYQNGKEKTGWASNKFSNDAILSPIIFERYLIAISITGILYGIDQNAGEMRWSYSIGGSVGFEPIVSKNMLYLVSNEGKVCALNLALGE